MSHQIHPYRLRRKAILGGAAATLVATAGSPSPRRAEPARRRSAWRPAPVNVVTTTCGRPDQHRQDRDLTVDDRAR